MPALAIPTAVRPAPVAERARTRYLDGCVRAQPFVKWVGGKRALVPEIIKHLPTSEINTYWEPFLGGGAVFFALDSRITEANLSDTNLDLAIAYNAVRSNLDDLLVALRNLAARHSKEQYLRIRRETKTEDNVRVAARFIYLNKTCYNGLYRVNRRNEFNVPMGSYQNPMICDEYNLRCASDVLDKAEIRCHSFEKISPREGDVVYCDPPYHNTFTNYTENGFSANDQEKLRNACIEWRNAGAHVIVSNSDTPLINDLYGNDFSIHRVLGRRNVNCKGSDRGRAPELLIVS